MVFLSLTERFYQNACLESSKLPGSNDSATVNRQSGCWLREKMEMGAKDKNENDRFYLYFASFLPKSIPSIKGLGSAPNIRNHTTHTRGPMSAMIHPPTTPGEPVQFPLERLSTPRLKAKQANTGARKHDFSLAAYCR